LKDNQPFAAAEGRLLNGRLLNGSFFLPKAGGRQMLAEERRTGLWGRSRRSAVRGERKGL